MTTPTFPTLPVETYVFDNGQEHADHEILFVEEPADFNDPGFDRAISLLAKAKGWTLIAHTTEISWYNNYSATNFLYYLHYIYCDEQWMVDVLDCLEHDNVKRVFRRWGDVANTLLEASKDSIRWHATVVKAVSLKDQFVETYRNRRTGRA